MQATTTTMIPVNQDRYLDTVSAAEFLCLSPDTLRKYRSAGIGPEFHKVNDRVVRYRVSDLVEWINSPEV